MTNDEQFITIRECDEFRRDMRGCIKEETFGIETRIRAELNEIKGYMKVIIAAIIGILAEATLALLTIILR